MSTLTYYRQARLDGGIRTGIEIDGETVLGRFEEGSHDEDPILAWFVTVEARGEDLPSSVEEARTWFVDHSEEIRSVLLDLADKLRVGLDPDAWPRRVTRKLGEGDVDLEVTCSALRRLAGQQIAEILRDIAGSWSERIRAMPGFVEASV